MDTHTEDDTEVYEPPMLEEIGGFTALTRDVGEGPIAEEYGYYNE
ncbi:MAG TPA: lasso RiPP family leader peptide-containing protein [Pseudonocardiaceae bacterium]|nr:lasso RiPP family leader peptide-containing protein [Pseudonocardiaceae bacterium]